jgi:hypothetical protein
MASGENVAELVAWYNSQRPVSMDIVGDFAGKELFAVHGEALILYCISEAKVDFDGTLTCRCLCQIIKPITFFNNIHMILILIMTDSNLCMVTITMRHIQPPPSKLTDDF